MKILAHESDKDIYILEASGPEIRLIAQIEGALEGNTREDEMSRGPNRLPRLPDHEKMATILRNFLSAMRDHNDFARSFETLKELLAEHIEENKS